jgi:probable F420-dependent oxidoreductase
MMYPVPYASAEEAVQLAVAAEEMGFESVWGNDHVSTQRYVRAEFADPPRFFDPFAYLAFVAARTERIRLATCVAVMVFRHPVVLAKQAATLDHLSCGRLVLGVGIGAYREEFEAMWPERDLHRGDHAWEYLEALGMLFDRRRASYRGTYVRFDDVECSPKPVRQALPILSGGNSQGARRRAAALANGWLPACLTPAEYAAGMSEIAAFAEDSGRGLPDGFETALQLVVSIADTKEAAIDRFGLSQAHAHLASLGDSTMRGRLDGLTSRNLVGTADDIGERVRDYLDAGVGTFAGLLFAAATVGETLEQMEQFAETVIRPMGVSR